MRLLHSSTLEFQVFHDDQIPPYAILSHTWGDEEVSYREMRFLEKLVALTDDVRQNHTFVAALEAAAGLEVALKSPIPNRAGYKKIEQTAKIARDQQLPYFWIDTCCIDKDSSAELQEAINSMYEWYRKSTLCVVYLEDAESIVDGQRDVQTFGEALQKSRWVTRGWTLQELIAPFFVAFYDQEWNYIIDKHSISNAICAVTGIPDYVLSTGDLSQASVAQKMSWAANRKTTRNEDRAYSLMGIFAVHMAMLYGEGDNAFRRLQEEIMRISSDDSIFAWRGMKGSLSGYCGLLARSPFDFRGSGQISSGKHRHNTFATSNLGLRIEINIQPVPRTGLSRNWDESLYLCMLDAEYGNGKKIALLLRRLEPLKYARVWANSCWDWTTPHENPTTLYIEHMPQIPRSFKSCVMRCFHLRRSSREVTLPTYEIECVRPYDLWDSHHQELQIPENYFPYIDDHSFAEHDFAIVEGRKHFIGMIWLRQVNNADDHPFSAPFQILLGYDPSTGRVWCKILLPGPHAEFWPDVHASTKDWRAALRRFGEFQNCKSYDNIDLSALSKSVENGEQIKVEISPSLRRGLISHVVEIDSLLYHPHRIGAPVIRARSNL